MKFFQFLIDTIQKPPVWNGLRVVGNSNIAKMTIFVPIVGYMILFNTNLIGYLELSGSFVWHGGNAPSYRLFFFYFGLSFIGLGSLIFQVRCPHSIKSYPTLDQYTDRERNILSLSRMDSLFWLIERDLKILKPNPSTASSYLIRIAHDFVHKHKPDHYLEDQRQRASFENEALKLHWLLLNHTAHNTRLLIAAIYGVGFIFLSIPTLDTFIRVCIAFYLKLF